MFYFYLAVFSECINPGGTAINTPITYHSLWLRFSETLLEVGLYLKLLLRLLLDSTLFWSISCFQLTFISSREYITSLQFCAFSKTFALRVKHSQLKTFHSWHTDEMDTTHLRFTYKQKWNSWCRFNHTERVKFF